MFHHVKGLIWSWPDHLIKLVKSTGRFTLQKFPLEHSETDPYQSHDHSWFSSVVPFCCTVSFPIQMCVNHLKNVKRSILYHDGKIEIKWLPYFVNMMTVHHCTCDFGCIALLRVSIWVMCLMAYTVKCWEVILSRGHLPDIILLTLAPVDFDQF